MHLQFEKYQGAGNDFILIDGRNTDYKKLNKATIAALCNRRFGIGADGLMLVLPLKAYDFEMVYYNSDGGESTMCGNGGRCIAAFAHSIGAAGRSMQFLAVDGPHEAHILDTGLVSLHMSDVAGIETRGQDYFLNTGSPHYVSQVADAHKVDTYTEGRKIRYNTEFAAQGTNVNFVSILPENKLEVATYERGVEDETLACGTGVVACSLVAAGKLAIHKGGFDIKVKGGNLHVDFEGAPHEGFRNIWLTGPAVKVFSGSINL